MLKFSILTARRIAPIVANSGSRNFGVSTSTKSLKSRHRRQNFRRFRLDRRGRRSEPGITVPVCSKGVVDNIAGFRGRDDLTTASELSAMVSTRRPRLGKTPHQVLCWLCAQAQASESKQAGLTRFESRDRVGRQTHGQAAIK